MRRSVRNALAIVGGFGRGVDWFCVTAYDAGCRWHHGCVAVCAYWCGLWGVWLWRGDAISAQILKKDPELAQELEIEQQDERRVMIAERSKARAFDMMTYALGALMLCFALMKVELSWCFYLWVFI